MQSKPQTFAVSIAIFLYVVKHVFDTYRTTLHKL